MFRYKQPLEKQISTYVVKSGKKNMQLADLKLLATRRANALISSINMRKRCAVG
jgi:hypothetical protein